MLGSVCQIEKFFTVSNLREHQVNFFCMCMCVYMYVRTRDYLALSYVYVKPCSCGCKISTVNYIVLKVV